MGPSSESMVHILFTIASFLWRVFDLHDANSLISSFETHTGRRKKFYDKIGCKNAQIELYEDSMRNKLLIVGS